MNDNMMTSHSGIHCSMLLCCGSMIVIFGALTNSSLATTIGLSTGQTYLTIVGFVGVSLVSLVYLYRRPADSTDK